MNTDTQKDAIHRLVQDNLSVEQQQDCLRDLALDSLTPELVTEAVRLFRTKMVAVPLPHQDAVDPVGTGGDKSGSFNISTTSALAAAAAGTPIAKHGNISISSKSGGVDLLKELQLTIPSTAAQAVTEFERNNIVFFFAQLFHPVFKNFTAARRALAAEGVITLFNILGPLLNPAKTQRTVTGVFRADLVPLVAEVKRATGTKKALIVHGNGMDELTLTGENTIAEINGDDIRYYTKTPDDFGLSSCTADDIQGGSPQENAVITRGIFDGNITGAKKDIVILNTAAAIYAGDDDITFDAALEKARHAIESGAAKALLERLATA
ncbi:MAG: anthranilate phosphoribosyltransferase [Alphaproteobacteria bacterium]|nr:MAG: anthranilate phosphoribosyltransferase [Alphaproteobacteria bacterium]